MIELTHLKIIKQVNTYGTLTQAAENLFLTQSALSHAIKKLEGQLGANVWKKDGRNLRLTDAGQSLLALADRVLPQFEQTEQIIQQIAQGKNGTLKIGMECHPCYQWLLSIVSKYLDKWKGVDVDVKQRFQFGGMQALFNYDIDALITPDPLFNKGLIFTPVFDYELVLVTHKDHHLAHKEYVLAKELSNETLITYPVDASRLDIFSQFFTPAKCSPKLHKSIETTDIMLQMVANHRGITALPAWLVAQYAKELPIKSIQLGKKGIHKQIFVGIRKDDTGIDYLNDFLQMAQETR